MNQRPYLTGLNLLMTLIFTYLLSAVTLLVGHSLSAWIFPASFIFASFAILAWCHNINLCIRTILTSLLIIILSLIAATILEDHSYDGNCYHQEIIARLMYGWNPYHEYYKSITDGFSIAKISIWAMHYAKAIEISCASVGMLTGAVESGKAINLIFIASSFLLTYGLLGEIFQASQHWLRLAIATISTANPVCMTQAPTFYIDYVKYYLLIFIIIQSYKIITTDKLREHLLLGGVILVGIGSKFNIFFETGLALMAVIAWCIYKSRWRISLKIIATGIISFVIGAFIIGYHPYVTNWITAGHPLYPLLGEGAVILWRRTPPIFIRMDVC